MSESECRCVTYSDFRQSKLCIRLNYSEVPVQMGDSMGAAHIHHKTPRVSRSRRNPISCTINTFIPCHHSSPAACILKICLSSTSHLQYPHCSQHYIYLSIYPCVHPSSMLKSIHPSFHQSFHHILTTVSIHKLTRPSIIHPSSIYSYTYLYIYLPSIHLPIYPSIYLPSTHVPIHLLIHLSIHLMYHLSSIHLPISKCINHLSTASINPSTYHQPTIYLSINLYTHNSIYQRSTHYSIHLPTDL